MAYNREKAREGFFEGHEVVLIGENWAIFWATLNLKKLADQLYG